MNHNQCAHAATPADRARCRKARASEPPPVWQKVWEDVIADELAKHPSLSGWTFAWINTTRILGRCDYGLRQIQLSRVMTPVRSHPNVWDTIWHEIAHALCGQGTGHSELWRKKAIELGSKGEVCAEDVTEDTKAQVFRWVGTCPSGEHRHYRAGKPRQRHSCRYCIEAAGARGFDERFLITWERNVSGAIDNEGAKGDG